MANSPARVIVVDDDEGVLTLERRALQRAGYEIVAVTTADAALGAASSQPLDVMVIDYRLGGPMSGIDVYRQLRARGIDIPTILVTAFSDEQRILEALRAGFRDVVPKTTGYLEYLPAAIARVLNQVEAERALHEASGLRESERRFRRLANAMPQLAWTARPDGTISYANDRYREFIGIEPADAAWNWIGALHPDDRQRTIDAWQHSVHAGTVYEIEHRIRRADGEFRWQVTRAVPVRDEDGTIDAWYGTTTDIDALKQAQEASRRNEERLRLAVEAARMFAFEWDRRTDVVVRSAECLEILGEDAGVRELASRFFQRVHPEDRGEYIALTNSVTPASPNYHGAYRLIRSDGRVVYLETTARALFAEDGSIQTMIGMTADVSLRREAERRLSQTTAILRAVAESTPDLMYVKDRDHRLLFANPATERVIGRPEAELIGLTEREYYRDQAQAETILATDRRIMRSGIAESVEETVSGPGGTRTYLATKSPLRDDTGRVVGLVGISSDITDRVAADAERRDLLERERNARADAERANVLKDEFLATLSHELRTPLNAILGWAQVLSTRRIDDEKRLRQILETIARNAQVQVRLIEDLLDMSRILSGKMQLHVQPVHLPAIVKAAVDSIRPAADAKRLQFRFRAESAAGVPFRGDAARLQQVVWNLLSNAVKFTPTGGTIDVALDSEDDRLLLTVIDSGPGIPPEFLPYVFDRFRQADASPTRAHGGLGLGLSIARHLVELHGGTISAGNVGPRGGARFAVTLPAGSDLSILIPVEPTIEHRTLSGIRILVADDEPDTRELVARILEDSGAVVTAVGSADAALDRFRRDPFDVLVIDIAMPVRDGYDVIREVRADLHPDRRATPAVALTAFARVEDRDRALAGGFTRYASKPITPDQLVAVVSSALEAKN